MKKKTFYQGPYRTILGFPKRALHLVWNACGSQKVFRVRTSKLNKLPTLFFLNIINNFGFQIWGQRNKILAWGQKIGVIFFRKKARLGGVG